MLSTARAEAVGRRGELWSALLSHLHRLFSCGVATRTMEPGSAPLAESSQRPLSQNTAFLTSVYVGVLSVLAIHLRLFFTINVS